MRKGAKIAYIILGLGIIVSFVGYYKYVIKFDSIPVKEIEIKKVDSVEDQIEEEFNLVIAIPNKEIDKKVMVKGLLTKEEKVKSIYNEVEKELRKKQRVKIDGIESNISVLEAEIPLTNVFLDGSTLYLNFGQEIFKELTSDTEKKIFFNSLIGTYTKNLGILRMKFLVGGSEIGNELEVDISRYYGVGDEIGSL